MKAWIFKCTNCLPVSDSKLEEIRAQTEMNPQFQTLKGVIQRGGPEEKRKYPMSVSEFWNHHNELSYLHGIIFKVKRFLLPQAFVQICCHKTC